MDKIISVQPVPEYFSITWMLGSLCNYDCMYCPSDLHDSVNKLHDLDQLQQGWTNIYEKTRHLNLKYKISFTGGEVTANKNFLPLVQWLRENCKDIAMILISTNGSASLNYYKKLSSIIESIAFSTHSEFMDEADFFKKAEEINSLMVPPKKSFHVNIMDEYWNQDRIKIYQKWLTQKGINHSINKINYNHQTRTAILTKGIKNFEQIIKS